MISKAVKDLSPNIGAVGSAFVESFKAAGATLPGLIAGIKTVGVAL